MSIDYFDDLPDFDEEEFEFPRDSSVDAAKIAIMVIIKENGRRISR